MKALLLILALALSAQAQDWKLIKEMSGTFPKSDLRIEVYAAEIARSDDKVKLMVRMDFPQGAPRLEGASYPRGFDPTSISRVIVRVEFNCRTLVFKPVKGSADVYQFNGKKLKSKEPPFAIESGNIFSVYFCERGEKPTLAPTLKPK